MIDIPGIYVGRFKDDPNQSPMLIQTITGQMFLNRILRNSCIR